MTLIKSISGIRGTIGGAVSDNLTLKFAAKNISNPLIRTFYKAYDDDFNAVKISKEDYKKGRSFSLSLNYDF